MSKEMSEQITALERIVDDWRELHAERAREVERLEQENREQAAEIARLNEEIQSKNRLLPSLIQEGKQGAEDRIDELEAELARLKPAMLALESLTPGGSEYVGDVERCMAHIHARQQSQHQAIVKFKGERDELRKAARLVTTQGEHASDCPFRPALSYAQAISTCTCGMIELHSALAAAFPEQVEGGKHGE